MRGSPSGSIEVHPLTPGLWDDFELLFGERGACGGCWCMTPRLSRADYEANKGEGNRLAMKALVDNGRVTGLLGYRGTQPIAWCSVEPRELVPWVDRSRLFRGTGGPGVWSIVCLFVDKAHRGAGVSVAMIEGAVAHAARAGAACVEAYPIIPQRDEVPAAFAWVGLASAYARAGFVEVDRPSATRARMRYTISRALPSP